MRHFFTDMPNLDICIQFSIEGIRCWESGEICRARRPKAQDDGAELGNWFLVDVNLAFVVGVPVVFRQDLFGSRTGAGVKASEEGFSSLFSSPQLHSRMNIAWARRKRLQPWLTWTGSKSHPVHVIVPRPQASPLTGWPRDKWLKDPCINLDWILVHMTYMANLKSRFENSLKAVDKTPHLPYWMMYSPKRMPHF